MPKRLFEEITNWAGGINTAAHADALLVGTSPRGRNSALTNISPNPPRALASKRKGALPGLATPLTSEPAIIGQFYFKKSDGTKVHVLVCGDGSLRERNSDGTHASISAGLFTAGDELLPGFAAANDLLFITNGSEEKKFDGTAASKFGIAQRAAPTATAGGAGGTITAGTYDVLLTEYNSATGHEGPISASDDVTITAGQVITVSWTAPTDTQVTHVRVYVRQRTRGSNYYRAIAGATPAPDATYGGYTPATTSTVLDITEAQFDAFRLLAPGDTANYPPPTGAKSPTWHKSRMFVHDGANLYWSEFEKPEAFDTTNNKEPVNPDDGDQIVALHSAQDVLLVLKRKSAWALVGDDPASWTLQDISSDMGAVNQQCVKTHGATYWWDAQKGPVKWAGGGTKPVAIGVPEIGPTIDPELLNKDKLHLIVAEVDDAPSAQRLLWAVPDFGKTRNTTIFPYNLMLGVWESDIWNPFDVASMAVAEDENSTPWVWMGGFSGRLFQWWNATNDGVPVDAVSRGSFTNATTSTVATVLDDDGASPGWVTDELKELYAYSISADGLDIERRRITANTANTFTVSPAWGATPNEEWDFVIGGIDFQFDTPWLLGDAPFFKKRYEHLMVQVLSPDSNVPVSVDLFLNYDLLNVARANEWDLEGAVVYDTAIYDRDRYAAAVLGDKRFRISKTGKAWRARIRNVYPDQELTLLKVAMQSVLLTTKS